MADAADAWPLRLELLHRENAARARALDADRPGDDGAAAHWRHEARRALADRLALPDPTAVELARRLAVPADAYALADQHKRAARAAGAAAETWRADMEDALAQTWQLRRAAAGLVVKGRRWAAELEPAGLAAALAQAAPPAEMGRLRAEVAELRGALVELTERAGAGVPGGRRRRRPAPAVVLAGRVAPLGGRRLPPAGRRRGQGGGDGRHQGGSRPAGPGRGGRRGRRPACG